MTMSGDEGHHKVLKGLPSRLILFYHVLREKKGRGAAIVDIIDATARSCKNFMA